MTGAAVVSALAAVYTGYQAYNTPTPEATAPPPPANSYTYNPDGTSVSTVWDPGRNAYVTSHNAAPPPDMDAIRTMMRTDEQAAFDAANTEGQATVDAKGTPVNTLSSRNMASKRQNPFDNNPILENNPFTGEQTNVDGMSSEELAALPQYQEYLERWQSESSEYQDWIKATEAREKENELRTGIRTQMLENLNQTPEDRVQAYDDFAKAYSDSMHVEVDEQFDAYSQSLNESMNQRGLTGSRADVDLNTELSKNKLRSDLEIADRTTMAKETLGAQDRNFWLGTLTALDAGMSSEKALMMQSGLANFQGAAAANATNLGIWDAQNTNAMNFATSERNRLLGASNMFSQTSSGLAYLYGLNNPGNDNNNPMAAPVSVQGANSAPSNWAAQMQQTNNR